MKLVKRDLVKNHLTDSISCQCWFCSCICFVRRVPISKGDKLRQGSLGRKCGNSKLNLVGKLNEYVIKGIMFSPLFPVVFVLWVCNVDKISWPIWPTTFRVIADTDIAFESVSKVIQNVVVGSRRGHTCSLFKFQLIHYRLWSHLHIHSRGKTYANTHVVLLKIAFKNMNWNPLLLPVWNLATITITSTFTTTLVSLSPRRSQVRMVSMFHPYIHQVLLQCCLVKSQQTKARN